MYEIHVELRGGKDSDVTKYRLQSINQPNLPNDLSRLNLPTPFARQIRFMVERQHIATPTGIVGVSAGVRNRERVPRSSYRNDSWNNCVPLTPRCWDMKPEGGRSEFVSGRVVGIVAFFASLCVECAVNQQNTMPQASRPNQKRTIGDTLGLSALRIPSSFTRKVREGRFG